MDDSFRRTISSSRDTASKFKWTKALTLKCQGILSSRETTTLVNQIEGFFKKCYKKEILDMANVLVYSIKSNVRQFCRKKTKKLTKLLENTPCINTVIQDNRCIVLFANNTKQLIPAKMSDQSKIRHTCCFYVESMRCSDEYLDALPCIRDNKEIMLDFVRGIFGSFIDVMCGT